MRRRGAEAAAEVLVEEQAHLVALDGQRIVVLALPELDVALAGLVVEGAAAWAAPRLASEVCDTRLLSSVLPKPILWPTEAAPPLVPQLLVFLSAAKHLNSLQTSSPESPAPISAMSTTWPSLKSLNCLVFAALVLSFVAEDRLRGSDSGDRVVPATHATVVAAVVVGLVAGRRGARARGVNSEQYPLWNEFLYSDARNPPPEL